MSILRVCPPLSEFFLRHCKVSSLWISKTGNKELAFNEHPQISQIVKTSPCVSAICFLKAFDECQFDKLHLSHVKLFTLFFTLVKYTLQFTKCEFNSWEFSKIIRQPSHFAWIEAIFSRLGCSWF